MVSTRTAKGEPASYLPSSGKTLLDAAPEGMVWREDFGVSTLEKILFVALGMII